MLFSRDLPLDLPLGVLLNDPLDMPLDGTLTRVLSFFGEFLLEVMPSYLAISSSR